MQTKHTRTPACSSSKKDTTRTPRRQRRTKDEADHVETLDLVAVAEKYDRSARLVKSLFEPDALPDWLSNLILRGLELATEKTGIGHYNDSQGTFDLRGLADLLAITQGMRHEEAFEFEPKKDLPELVSATLRHPGIPASVYNALSEAVDDLWTDDTDPMFIRLVLTQHAQQREGSASDGA